MAQENEAHGGQEVFVGGGGHRHGEEPLTDGDYQQARFRGYRREAHYRFGVRPRVNQEAAQRLAEERGRRNVLDRSFREAI